MKNFSSITEDLDITTKKYVDDNKVTSIDGLTGGTLTSPLKVTGGDGTSASKIALNQSGSGQITDSGTSTIFGFMSASDLTVGSANYNTRFRGKQTRPTWNGNDLALKSDIPDVSGKANLNGGNDFFGRQSFVLDEETDGADVFLVNDIANGVDYIKATAGSGLDLPQGFATSGTIDCRQGTIVGDYNEFLALNYSDINHPVLSITDGATVDLDGSKGAKGQVFTSNGDGTAPYWSTPAIKSATLNSTTKTLYLTLTDNVVSSNLSAASDEYPYNQIY